MIEFVNQDLRLFSFPVLRPLTLVVMVACGEISQAQTPEILPSIKGTPRVIHYTRKDFNSDPQIWTMCQDKDGILYFGTNKGTLIFDGETWQTVHLPNNSSVRSLAVNDEGTVFTGGFNEFGTIRKDPYGKYYYESWIHLLRPEDRNIENIWGIHQVQGYMVFRSYKLLIAIANNKAITLPTAGMFEFSTVLNDRLFVTDGDGLKTVDLHTLDFSRVIGARDLNDENFLSVLPGNSADDILVVTKEGSFFEIDPGKHNARFLHRVLPPNANNLVTSAIKSSSGNYYLGTLTSKVMLVRSGKKATMLPEVFHDLQDNTVHNLFESREGNVWALLNNGIDCIDINSPVTLLLDNASVFDVLFHDRKIFVATNQGVFVAETGDDARVSKDSFRKVPGLEGHAWSLQQFEGQVLCSHDRGVFVFDGRDWRKVEGAKGIWKVVRVNGASHQYLACTYDGLFSMRHGSSGFVIVNKIEGFGESSRDILQGNEPGVFWICHGYKGVFRIKIDPDFERLVGLEHFKDANGLPSPFNINVRRWNNEIVFTTNHGVFNYNEKNNRFELFPPLTRLFGTRSNVRQLHQFGEKTWFVHADEVGFFNSKDVQPFLSKGLFLQLKGTLNESMECIVHVNDENVLIGTREGLYSLDLNYKASRTDAKTLITSVRYREDSLEHACALARTVPQPLPYRTRIVRFDFAVPDFDDKINTQYSYKVDGIGGEWSSWQDKPFAEYSLLPPGAYTFRVRARSMFGENAREAAYPFEIIPVWYRTAWAYLIYAGLSLVLASLLVKLIHRRIEFVKYKTRTEEEEKRKFLEVELERMKLRREKEAIFRDKVQLEEDVIFKSKELANYTMLLVKKREFLSEIFELLDGLRESIRHDQARQTVRDIQKKINANLQSEEHLKVFEANFERVHHQFFSRLKANFPDLSAKELQLCAFVKMNLTNKEIASILNLSVRGIETARYRLRKRLAISQEQDMADFLEKLYSSSDTSAVGI
jgi:AraC family transcriptional regulator, chitin signaling transcriptional activator